ncbi:hypothetical protein ACJDU8_17055 [Clostridium sp. WILCCON 0269]|uniref:Uncharacterized protein n=1 Tax=Candidatus Clostridium eludens TaxID=3381663 RepID=A0ABW8SNL5_9CLOT
MIKLKYKIISAAMIAAPLLLNTGIATTVHASPANNKPGVVYNSKYKVPAKPAPKVVNTHKTSHTKPAPEATHSAPHAKPAPNAPNARR